MSNRLLVIDDANIHRMILCRIGEKVGFETVGAASFDEAAKLLRENEFDCVTLDLSLGERAGVEVLHLLSVIKSQAPIIIISGAEHTVCEETLKIGKSLNLNLCTPVPKPVDLAALRESLAHIGQQVNLQKLARAPL
ncbi:MAG TPA: response regulator [Terriglobales bacterium]|jgi:DNA-binding NtrC family response regulator|nr:response regulator [Terriglobales bacterium]